MMASHRSADPPPPPPPPEPAAPDPTIPAAPGGKTTLPPSNFLVGFDWVLAFGVLALGFLVASFAVRNADFWMHLATGRLLIDGGYSLGTDPFSYVGEGRTWVNHAWLFDGLLYLLYKAAGGPGVVIAKGIAVALTAGLLLLARRPGQAVFPGVVCAGLALVASAPRLILQPAVASYLLLAALLCLLVRVPRRPGSWLFPGLVAALFWLWANCDQWFFLGPVALLLYTAGQYVRPDEGEDIPSLWKALGLGVVACMLNPHHVRVWELPAELADSKLADAFKKDPEFLGLFRGAFDPGALDFAGDRDNPANLYALLALVALTLIGFAVNYRRASAGLALAWAGAVALALLHVRAVPFLALVSAPVAAVNLAAAGRRLADTPLSDGTVRTLQALRAGGRGVAGLACLLAVALTYAGWLHPSNMQARWKWDLEPDPSQARAAERLGEWRQSGALPPEARLLNLQPGFASYAAWYAPGAKTFFDHRIGFHRPEAAEYAALRRYLALPTAQDRKADAFNFNDFLARYNVTFAVSAHPSRNANQMVLTSLWEGEGGNPGADPAWVLWDVQGRAVTLGWARQQAVPTAAFDQLRFDPVQAAYVDARPLPAPAVQPPALPGDVWERFLAPPPPDPVEVEEAIVLLRYRDALAQRTAYRFERGLYAVHAVAHNRLLTPAAPTWTNLHPLVLRLPYPPELTAVSVLAVRAARQAIAASPDHPDGYTLLALAYANDGFRTTEDFRELVGTVSRARARARLPAVPVGRRPGLIVQLCRELARGHLQALPPRLDLALDTLRLARTYLQLDVEDREAVVGRGSGAAADGAEAELDVRKRELADVDRMLTDLDAQVKKNTDAYVVQAAGQAAALDRAAVARRQGLIREATAELRKAHDELQKQLADQPNRSFDPTELATHLAVHAELIELLWYEGRVEEAQDILKTVDTPDVLRVMDTPAVRQAYAQARQRALGRMFPDPRQRPVSPHDTNPAAHFRSLRLATNLVVGDFEKAAGEQAEQAAAVRKELTEFRAKHFPGDVPSPTGLGDPNGMQRDMYTRPVLAPVTFARLIQFQNLAHLLDLWQARADGQLRLGLTYLEGGEPRRAADHFRQATELPGPWAVPTPLQRMAREYLRGIDRAAPGSGAGP